MLLFTHKTKSLQTGTHVFIWDNIKLCVVDGSVACNVALVESRLPSKTDLIELIFVLLAVSLFQQSESLFYLSCEDDHLLCLRVYMVLLSADSLPTSHTLEPWPDLLLAGPPLKTPCLVFQPKPSQQFLLPSNKQINDDFSTQPH